jgi:cytochrome oxidase Cu insertion factor (SCO1/SenC/PrrC family)
MMKHLILLFAINIAFFVGLKSQTTKVIDELKLIGEKMSKVKTVEYDYKISTDMSFSGKTSIKGQVHFESNDHDTIIGMKYISELLDYKSVYNQGEIITLCKSDSFAFKKPLFDFNDGHGTSYSDLEMSFCAIKLFLANPDFQTKVDSLIRKDTIVGSKACTYYSFWANEQFVDVHKYFNKRSKKVELIFENSTSLPVYYSQRKIIPRTNGSDYIFQEVDFKNYNFSNTYPSSAFEIEAVPDYYSWDKRKMFFQSLPNNTLAPDWTLPDLTGDSLALSSLRGKYVLLDFWFIGCGACNLSIPTLNELQQKYGHEKLNVVGVNCFSKDKAKVVAYCNNLKMSYKNVWSGDSITKSYLINAAPIFYLIDPDGQIVYSQIGEDKEKLISHVDSFLK